MPDSSEDAEAEEILLETAGIAQAVQSFKESWDRTRLSDSKAGKTIMTVAFPPLTEAIRAEQDRIKAGARPDYWKEITVFDAERLAYLTILTILDGFRGTKSDEKLTKYTMLSKRIGDWCKLEYLVDQEPEADRIRRWISAKRDKNASRAAKRYKPFAKIGWKGKKASIKLGSRLLTFAEENGGGLFLLIKKDMKPTRLVLTGKGLKILARCREIGMTTVRPKFLPMLSPPRPWTGNEGGGYKRLGLSLVKRDEDLDIQEALKKADLRIVCEAVNALQATPYRINQRLAAVFSAVCERRGPAAVLPFIEIPPMPPRLPKETTPLEEYNRRQHQRYRVGRVRAIAAANLIALDRRLAIVKILGNRTFYFPHQIDLRSRAYPIPQEVHPQADDIGRSLLEFARGKPLGERGGFWLAVQLANLYGNTIDKLPLQKRFDWVQEHTREILDSAERPLEGEMFWAGAEKKWRFLAAAFEWTGYVAQGADYISQLPIAMDGTCNGMQHLSALGRDPVGGAWTNVVPNVEPQDLYQRVADHLKDIVDEKVAEGHPMAILWKSCIKRSLVKQATMTTPYGVTISGMAGQIRSIILESDAYRERFEDEKAAAQYLAPLVNKAIARVAVGATAIRKWLKKVVKKLAKRDRGLSWTVPTGFPVLHEYREQKPDRVNTVRGKQLVYQDDTSLGIKTKKQNNSIVPNFIHSLDAAHMMYTVRELVAQGLRDFSMVHDGYAVHACDVDLMNKTLREQFVRLHTEYSLEKFLEQVKAGAPGIRFTKRLAPPPMGTLNLDGVLRSEYFFS